MRTSAIWMMLGLCGALSSTGCAKMAAIEKEVKSDLKTAQDVKKEVDAVKKGDVGAGADAALEIAVKGALTKDAKTKGAGIDVDAKGGVVTLKGSAAGDVKSEAERVAKGVPGVSKVVNKIGGAAAKDEPTRASGK